MGAIRKTAAVVAVLAVVAGVGVAYSNGVGPFAGDGSPEIEEPDSRGEVVELGDDGTVDVDEGEEPPAFTLEITEISGCGQTCREVSATLTNNMEEDATNTTVYSRIYAGNGTDGDRIWADNRGVGTLGVNRSTSNTDTIELGMTDIPKVSAQEGWVTIETTVESDQATVTFVRQEKVL